VRKRIIFAILLALARGIANGSEGELAKVLEEGTEAVIVLKTETAGLRDDCRQLKESIDRLDCALVAFQKADEEQDALLQEISVLSAGNLERAKSNLCYAQQVACTAACLPELADKVLISTEIGKLLSFGLGMGVMAAAGGGGGGVAGPAILGSVSGW